MIPNITGDFYGTKEVEVFREIMDDAKSAQMVRVLTYSAIYEKYSSEEFSFLKNLGNDNDKDLKIIVGLPSDLIDYIQKNALFTRDI